MTSGAARRPDLRDGAPAAADRALAPLLEDVLDATGLDFRNYAVSTVRRRVERAREAERVPSLDALRERVRLDPAAAGRVADALSVKVTAMFRDPPFWRALRAEVVPLLRPLPFVRVWIAGCCTGEEAWSMAILLREEGLYARSRVYATDVDAGALARADAGAFPLDVMREYTHNYQRAGGKAAFSDYYAASDDAATFAASLRRNLVFARHNLATDESFNEFHVVLCRNVLIYFAPPLQERALRLFWRSLAPEGVLALGHREQLPRAWRGRFADVDAGQRIHRRRAEGDADVPPGPTAPR